MLDDHLVKEGGVKCRRVLKATRSTSLYVVALSKNKFPSSDTRIEKIIKWKKITRGGWGYVGYTSVVGVDRGDLA